MGQLAPAQAAPALRGPEVKLSGGGTILCLNQGPEGPGWIPPAGNGACAHRGPPTTASELQSAVGKPAGPGRVKKGVCRTL